MVCSTPHALSPDALSHDAFSPRVLSPCALSPHELIKYMENQAFQVDLLGGNLSKIVFLTSYIKETGLSSKLFTI